MGHWQFTLTEILSEVCISGFGGSAPSRSWESCRGVTRLVVDTTGARCPPGLLQREVHSGPHQEQRGGCDTGLKGRGMWNGGKWDNPWKCSRIQKYKFTFIYPFDKGNILVLKLMKEVTAFHIHKQLFPICFMPFKTLFYYIYPKLCKSSPCCLLLSS